MDKKSCFNWEKFDALAVYMSSVTNNNMTGPHSLPVSRSDTMHLNKHL